MSESKQQMDRNMIHLADDEHEKSELNNLVGQNIETIIEHLCWLLRLSVPKP
jgi:hypothetical protein